jgi:hypothetical protein
MTTAGRQVAPISLYCTLALQPWDPSTQSTRLHFEFLFLLRRLRASGTQPTDYLLSVLPN